MSQKWYNVFVSFDQAAESQVSAENDTTAASPAQAVAEIAAAVTAEPVFKESVQDPAAFEQIYQAAEIQKPAHGYTIFKIIEMLQNPLIKDLGPEVKRSSILLALDAAGVKINDIIEDAIRRDKALDTYERVLERSLLELESRNIEANRKLEAEMEQLINELRAKIQKNNEETAQEKDRFAAWRLQKQAEEKRIAEAAGYFVPENPITT